MKSNWVIKEADKVSVSQMALQCNIDQFLMSLMHARGLTDIHSIFNFLYPQIMSSYSPFEMKDMDLAVDRIKNAIVDRENIAIFADSDLDGITSLTTLYALLDKFDIRPFIRYLKNDESYGLSKDIVQEFIDNNITLLITVDSGTRDVDEIKFAKDNGIDVIITDHHQPDDILPEAIILNPKRVDCNYPFKHLAGVGVVFKLCCGILMSFLPGHTKTFHLIGDDSGKKILVTVSRGIVDDFKHFESTELMLDSLKFCDDDVYIFYEKDDYIKLSGKADQVFYIVDDFLKNNSNYSELTDIYSILFNELSGIDTKAQLMYKFFIQLQFLNSNKISNFIDFVIQFVTIGSIADVMPIIDENRMFVIHGIKQLKSTTHDALSKLVESDISAKKISWSVAPLLNSPGRYGRTDLVVDLFLEKNSHRIGIILNTIRELNEQRKAQVEAVYNSIVCSYENGDLVPFDNILFTGHIDTPDGLLGLIANKLSDHFNIPVIAVGMVNEDGQVKGSGRSKNTIDIFSYFEKHTDKFERIGGHTHAFGFTADPGIIKDLIPVIDADIAQTWSADNDTMLIDLELNIEDINSDLILSLSLLEPYGQANPEPVFLSKKVELESFSRFGNDKHGKYCVRGNKNVAMIGWNIADEMETFFSGNKAIDVVYNLENNYFKGTTSPRMTIIDLNAST